MQEKKYLSDYIVNIFSKSWLMYTADQVTNKGSMDRENKKISDQCHIYLICTRPKIFFEPARFNYNYSTGNVSGSIFYRVNGEKREVEFESHFPLSEGATKVELSKYPHHQLVSLDNQGHIVRYLPAYALSIGLAHHINCPDLQQLNVRYVGQAYGKGKRSALERLRSHSTLQRILADAHREAPDDDVIILTFEYCPYRVLAKFDGRNPVEAKTVNDAKRFKSILDNPLTQYQQICLIEAALIRFFKPNYNTIYKESFPTKNMKILKECNDLDFSGLVVEINTEDLGFLLFSDEVAARFHHITNFDLVEYKQRIGFFLS